MASISKLQTTKDGRRFWKISVSRGYGITPYTTRFYWPENKNGHPASEKTAVNELNRYAAQFELDCKAGLVLNRQQKAERVKEEQKAAEQAAAEQAKIKTVKQYAEEVFMPAKTLSVTENTRQNYQQFFDKHIYPAIGNELLKDVTPAMVTKVLLDFQRQGYSHGSCIKLYNVLNGLFEMAFMDDSISISPMLKVKRPVQNKDAATKPESEKALTAQEAKRVLDCIDAEYKDALCRFDADYDKERKAVYSAMLWKVYIELSADTGCRRGELCGLQWADIDWKERTISICRNLQYTPQKGVYIANTKTGKERIVDIGEETAALLKAFQKEQSAHHLSKWVFSQEGTAEPIHPQSPTRFFKKFGERHNIPDFHPHLLRHTFASMAIVSGADVVSVSQRLGHADTATTLRMYAHANPESIRAAGQAARDKIKAADKTAAAQ